MQNNVDFMVRGVRSIADMDSEMHMATINRRLCGKETVMLMASGDSIHISSSIIRELSSHKKRLDNYVPKEIEDEVYEHLFDYYERKRIH